MYKPFQNRVVVLPDPKDEKFGAGILYRPDVSMEQPNSGLVIAANIEGWTRRLEGTRVVYSKYAGTELPNPDDESRPYRVLHIDDLICEIEDEDTTKEETE